MTRLPSGPGARDFDKRFLGEVDASLRGHALHEALHRVEVWGLALPPAADAVVHDHQAHGGAFPGLPVGLHKDTPHLEEPRDGDPAGAVQLEDIEEARHEGGTQVRLVLDEGVGEPELRRRRLGNPGRELGLGPERHVHALGEVVTDQVGARLAVEEDHRVVVRGEARGPDDRLRDLLGAVEAQDLLD